MGSDEIVYENRVINHTFEPFLTPIILLVSLLCFAGSLYFYLYTRKRLKPEPQYEPPAAMAPKKEIVNTVKPAEGMKAQYSDDHLIVTSNMQERLKMFQSSNKIMK